MSTAALPADANVCRNCGGHAPEAFCPSCGQETDIRLLSVKSQAQAVIELKLANNDYSMSDLIKALETQLVGQYMRHDNCRAGCLLVTMNRKRTWKCPDDGSKLEFADVLSRLQHHAAELEARLNHEIRLAVVGIDLAS